MRNLVLIAASSVFYLTTGVALQAQEATDPPASRPNALFEELIKSGIKKVTVFEADSSHASSSCSAPSHSCLAHHSYTVWTCHEGSDTYMIYQDDSLSC